MNHFNFTPIFILFFTIGLSGQQWIEVAPKVSDISHVGDNLYTITTTGLFSHSEDNGETWNTTSIYHVPTLENRTFTSICFFDENNGIIALRNVLNGNQLLMTSDGGQNWEILNSDFGECSNTFIPIDLDFISGSTAMMDSHGSKIIYLTRDKGQSWTCGHTIAPAEYFHVISVRSENEWLSNGNQGFYKTINAGKDWEKIFDKHLIYFHEKEDGNIYGFTTDSDDPNGYPIIYKTHNDFETYETIVLEQLQDHYVTSFFMESESKIHVLVSGRQIYYSEDGGQNFELVEEMPDWQLETEFINGNWYFFGRGLWKLNSLPTYTNEISNEENTIVYPNPTSQFIHIKGEKYKSFELINPAGEILSSGFINNNQIDLTDLNRGAFLLKLKNEQEMIFRKVIKI